MKRVTGRQEEVRQGKKRMPRKRIETNLGNVLINKESQENTMDDNPSKIGFVAVESNE